jgi:hypothetical protein
MESSKPSLKPKRADDWPSANEGWYIVGGGLKVPGHASEKAANIEISKNPQWKLAGATVLPFKWNDGGCAGCSPHWKTALRYAILIIDTREKREWWKAA